MIKNLRGALAEAGKIKIGGLGAERQKKGGGTFRMPQKYTSFQITKNHRDQNGDLVTDHEIMAALEKDEDGRVREIPIVLHSDDIEAVFPTRYVYYQGRKLQCGGDGEEATKADGTKCPCPCPLLQQRKCKPNGVFHCSIAVQGHAVAGAVYKWRTTSIISIERMVGSLRQILATVGVLRGIPLRLRVEPVEVNPEGGAPTTVYCCHVVLKASDISAVQEKALEDMQRRKALANGQDLDGEYLRLVSRPGDESPREQAEVAAEFGYDTVTGEVFDQPPQSRVEALGAKLAERAAKQ